MKFIKLLLLILVITLAACKKKSSSTTTICKATLINVGPAMGYTGSATLTYDNAGTYKVEITHNLGTVTVSTDGIYNRITGAVVNNGGFFGKTSPMVVYGDITVGGSASDLLANLYEIRFYKAGAIVLQGTLNKQ